MDTKHEYGGSGIIISLLPTDWRYNGTTLHDKRGMQAAGDYAASTAVVSANRTCIGRNYGVGGRVHITGTIRQSIGPPHCQQSKSMSSSSSYPQLPA